MNIVIKYSLFILLHVEPRMVSVISSIKITDEEFFLCCVCIFMKSRVDVNLKTYFKRAVA